MNCRNYYLLLGLLSKTTALNLSKTWFWPILNHRPSKYPTTEYTKKRLLILFQSKLPRPITILDRNLTKALHYFCVHLHRPPQLCLQQRLKRFNIIFYRISSNKVDLWQLFSVSKAFIVQDERRRLRPSWAFESPTQMAGGYENPLSS